MDFSKVNAKVYQDLVIFVPFHKRYVPKIGLCLLYNSEITKNSLRSTFALLFLAYESKFTQLSMIFSLPIGLEVFYWLNIICHKCSQPRYDHVLAGNKYALLTRLSFEQCPLFSALLCFMCYSIVYFPWIKQMTLKRHGDFGCKLILFV